MFVPEFVSSERLMMRRFEDGLAFYIRKQLAGQPILTYQELYEQAAEVEPVKAELRTLNPINQKTKGFEWECEPEETFSRSSQEPSCRLDKALC